MFQGKPIPLKIQGRTTKSGMKLTIESKSLSCELDFNYPDWIWKNYPEKNKQKLLDNVIYVFTAHLPLRMKNNISLQYDTSFPDVYSLAQHSFIRHLPLYHYSSKKKHQHTVFPLLKKLLNTDVSFSGSKNISTDFSNTLSKRVIIPFTFGKDSLLTYTLTKELGLEPTLVYINEPLAPYENLHKLKLIKEFENKTGQEIYYLENPFAQLRDNGMGWFGWEMALTSYAILLLPFAYYKKARYIVFANEHSCNDFFYDKEGLKVMPDYEQSQEATQELSLLTQALSRGKVFTTTFLQGLYEVAIIGLLKNNYRDLIKYLMSCWGEEEPAKEKRWCAACSKCARIYLFLVANGFNPKEAGFQDNMLLSQFEHLFNVFNSRMTGSGYDTFITNRDEQLFAFYLAYLRGKKDPLVQKFAKAKEKKEAEKRFPELFEKYFSLHPESITPLQWKSQIDLIFTSTLQKFQKEIKSLRTKNLNLLNYQHAPRPLIAAS